MKYNFNISATSNQKLVIDNMEVEFYRHIQNGTMNGEPVVWDRMAVSVKVLDNDGNVIGKKATNDLYDFGETKVRFGAGILVDVIDYDTEPVDVAVCDREYFGVHIQCNGYGGVVEVILETGLGKYLDTGCGAISHIDTEKLPPSVEPYNVEV